MTAHKFTAHRHLRSVLDNVESVQKQDINDFSWGHLNERNLYSTPTQISQGRIWKSSKHIKPIDIKKEREAVKPVSPKSKPTGNKDKKMKDVLYDFSVGTTGSVAVPSPRKSRATPPRREKN